MMASLSEQLKRVRNTRGKKRVHPLEQYRNEILELLNKHGATQLEIIAWLEQFKDMKVTPSTLSRVLKKWREGI